MADTAPPVRIVPSGKVYRQMFDAQVQLTRTLTKLKQEDTQKTFDRQSTNVGIPLVRLKKDEVTHGLLTERQRTWADGFPNDPYVENPVLHKQYSEFVNATIRELDGTAAEKEVSGLPEDVVPTKQGSDIIDRIASSRRQRHEEAVEDMHQELSVINDNLEPRITECSDFLLEKLHDNDKDIARILAKISTDEDILSYSLDGLRALWEEVQGNSKVRQEWIEELDQQLTKAEDDRMDLIKEVFMNYSKTLEKIAHMMPPDLYRFLDQESQVINQTMLSNRRAYSDLYVRLMSTDIEREQSQHTIWKRRLEDWKKLKTDLSIQNFRDFMQSEDVVSPPGVQKVLMFMKAEQKILNKRRTDLIDQLSDLQPPASTKTAVYQWNKNIVAVTTEIDSVNQVHMAKLHDEYEQVCQKCLERIDSIKTSLLDDGIVTSTRVQQVIDDDLLPLVGERQRVFEQNLDTMDKALETHNNFSNEKLRSLFKYAQGSAHVWDVHEIGLAKQERALQEKLEVCRHQHDNQNQEKEANLDIIMDRMRQDASETSLRDSLSKALDKLEKIKAAYEVFHKDQASIVQQYPNMVKEELTNYDLAVCRFFMVDRHPDLDEPKVTITVLVKEKTVSSATTVVSEDRSRKGKKTSRKFKGKDKSLLERESTLPAAITETLSTDKGTLFYVLTVAGEHGVPPGSDEEVVSSPRELLFLTETPQVSESQPEYIRAIDIPDKLLLDVKRRIRINFLNQLEEWTEQAVQRSESVVIAKCEELNSELDLRLHLHKPRARRAELDVHNVRAAELVMHSERVQRHTKGIQQALNEQRQKFTKMTLEHNKLAGKFREDIEALETVFVNATKSSRLITLQNQLGVELEKFMGVIRTSLREFRTKLDETLQMLRESNARFIKSFKVFSDGGNFCPEEINDYRKKLEKMSDKIDSAEGSIMSDLEGMESKRLEQATKVALEFEDRFKSHMIDLIFMEKIARWLTNTQVKIKAEVASSNSQAQQLAQHLNDVDRRIDACARPNLDKELALKEVQITSSQLNESLKQVFEAFLARSAYLNAIKDPSPRPASALQGNPALGARVAFLSEVQPTPISKAGKQPLEDPSVGVIKNILKQQKSKLRFGIDAELDGEAIQMGQQQAEMREKMKSSLSTHTPSEKSKQTTRKSQQVLSDNAPKRVQSGLRRSSKSTKFDRKYLIFGEKDEEDEERHLLGVVKRTLREALDGLLTSGEMYYRQKGNRLVTRPQALQENFDQYAEVITQKLSSYFTQADEYHNQCLQEYRGQLTTLEHSVAHIPSLVIKDLLNDEIQKCTLTRQTRTDQFTQILNKLEKRQKEHEHLLRPILGHPHQQDGMKNLCKKEVERHTDYVSAVEKHTKELQEVTVECAKTFLEILARSSENQLLQYDNQLVVDDVERGRIDAKKYPTSELIRRRNAGLPLEDSDDKDALPRGKTVWPGIPNNELVVGSPPAKSQTTASVTTAKTTLGHSSVVKARDAAYHDYKVQFADTLQSIEDERQRLIHAEDRWMESWNKNIDKVRELF
ncbi:coiled-coil domain-containing protein 180-like isoform X3 [Mizuhopecten yessoensis]|uniref:coiled-coil domain-containing protein 180-like isoform X3 n=1 Tax=Mizuhopecten yessoensis TaxID=6573 RepID=UPI000B45D309|nr:coiled-coil domain-containing protein 180-like isoform X3 [Mizuhopecten yessoensis]